MDDNEKGIPIETMYPPGTVFYNQETDKKAEADAAAKYEAEQRKERRQQMKLQCISLAISTASSNQGMVILSENVVRAAKEYYKFVRT